MGARGKKSVADVLAAATINAQTSARLQAPAHLGDAARAVWIEAVNDQPADAFTAKDAPLLEAYCRHIVLGRLLAQELENFEAAWLARDDGLKRYDKLLAAHERENRAASSLATRLRITRQAMNDPKTVGRANTALARARRPWETSDAQ